jgi:hypothetical protein
MQNVNRRGLLSGFAIAASLGAASVGVVALPAFAQEIIITHEPPPMRREVIPVLPHERAEIDVWQPGYWRWNGREHVWVEGHYAARPRRGAEWVPAHYDRRPGGWVFIDGHWR